MGKSTEKKAEVVALILHFELKLFKLDVQQTTCALTSHKGETVIQPPLAYTLLQLRGVCAENWKLFAVRILDRLSHLR